MLGVHDRNVVLAQQRNERRRLETVMTNFDDVPQLAAVDLPRQQLEEFAEVGFVVLLGRRELPQHRTEPVSEFEHA